MDRKAILTLDAAKCTGCKLCETVCSLQHEGIVAPTKARISIIKQEDHGLDIPMFCQQCEKPLCREVCPARAIVLDQKLGIAVVDEDRCIGCLMCLLACPIGGITVTADKKIKKCDLCGGTPRCAKYCPTKAIEYVPPTKAVMHKRRRGISSLLALLEQPGEQRVERK